MKTVLLFLFSFSMFSAAIAKDAPKRTNASEPKKTETRERLTEPPSNKEDDTLVVDDITLYPGDMIAVDTYDASSRTYHLTYVKDPTAGPLNVALEDLAKAVTTLDLKKMTEKPNSILDHQYKLDTRLHLMFPDELEERRAKFKGQKE